MKAWRSDLRDLMDQVSIVHGRVLVVRDGRQVAIAPEDIVFVRANGYADWPRIVVLTLRTSCVFGDRIRFLPKIAFRSDPFHPDVVNRLKALVAEAQARARPRRQDGHAAAAATANHDRDVAPGFPAFGRLSRTPQRMRHPLLIAGILSLFVTLGGIEKNKGYFEVDQLLLGLFLFAFIATILWAVRRLKESNLVDSVDLRDDYLEIRQGDRTAAMWLSDLTGIRLVNPRRRGLTYFVDLEFSSPGAFGSVIRFEAADAFVDNGAMDDLADMLMRAADLKRRTRSKT